MSPPSLLLALALPGCGRGDWFPPERWMRAAFNGWDKWAGETDQPHETPMPPVPEGTVPFQGTASATNGFGTWEQAFAAVEALRAADRDRLGARAWARYCDHFLRRCGYQGIGRASCAYRGRE